MPKGALEWIVLILIAVGTINLGLGALGFDVVGMILSGTLLTILNVLIGIAGLYYVYGSLK